LYKYVVRAVNNNSKETKKKGPAAGQQQQQPAAAAAAAQSANAPSTSAAAAQQQQQQQELQEAAAKAAKLPNFAGAVVLLVVQGCHLGNAAAVLRPCTAAEAARKITGRSIKQIAKSANKRRWLLRSSSNM
jgi:hypothetical protein